MTLPKDAFPSHWTYASLGDLGTWAGGGTPSKQKPEYWTDGEVPWVSPKDMKQPVLSGSQDKITVVASEESAAKLRPANSIAFVTRSGILEHSLPVSVVPFEAAYNQDMKVLTLREDVDPCWLMWVLRGAAQDVLDSTRKDGTTVASIDFDRLKAYRLGIPALDEQRAIVAAIDDALARIDAIDGELTAVEELTANFRRASERDAFAAAEGSSMTLGDLCAQQGGAIQTGPFGSQLHARDYRDEGTPVLMPRDLDPEGINWDQCARVGDDDVDRLTRHLLEPGDIVQSRRGDLTRRAVVTAGSERALCGTGCFVIRLRDESLAHYVAAALSEPTVAYAIEEASAGVTMSNLNGKTLASVRIPVPDERSRGALLTAVSQSQEASLVIDARVAETRAEAMRLRASVLHRALTGELLGPSVSETASVAA